VLGAIAKPWQRHVQSYYKNLEALDVLLRQDGIPAIYLSVPLEGYADLRAGFPYSMIMANLAHGRKDRRHVNPEDDFCEHALGEVMLDFCHPSAKGHNIIAKKLKGPAEDLLRDHLIR